MIKTGDIKVKEIDGFQITVSDYSGAFTATKGDVEYSADKMDELLELIKRHKSNKRRFNPIDVIEIESDSVGRIPSLPADDKNSVYFTHKENPTAKATRSTVHLENWRGWGGKTKWNFVKATEENKAVLAAIETKIAERKALDKEIERLRQTYTEPVDWETIKQAGGEPIGH